MTIIKNNTPYVGKIFLTFEKDPNYSGSSYLNKIHLNLGFTKLVSRLRPTRTLEGSQIDEEKKRLIEANTGGKISTYTWYIVKGTKGTFKTTQRPKHDKDIIDEYTLYNSFVTDSGNYIGDIRDAWWYYQNNLFVCKEYPSGVALKIKDRNKPATLHNAIFDPYENFVTSLMENDNLEGYYGYTHRGGQLFQIGDRLFDEHYEPREEDYEAWQWAGWVEEFEAKRAAADDFDREHIYDSIKSIIPFKDRGPKVIETWSEALTAAKNLSNYLS